MSWLTVKESAGAAEIEVRGAIGSAEDAAAELAKIRGLSCSRVTVLIDSPGGSVFGGISLFNALLSLNARRIVVIDAIAASMASAIAMAGDEIVMADGAMLMIHDPTAEVWGGAQELLSMAKLLDKLRDTLANIYSGRSGQSVEKILGLMRVETWFTAQEARAMGMCTRIKPGVKAKAVARELTPKQIFAKWRALPVGDARSALFGKHAAAIWSQRNNES